MAKLRRKDKIIHSCGDVFIDIGLKRTYTGYLRVEESNDKTFTAIFLYHRRYKKFRMENSPKVRITIQEV